MDGGDTPRPSIQATFFELVFALHRLGVSGVRKRREQGSRSVGGGALEGHTNAYNWLPIKQFYEERSNQGMRSSMLHL